MVSDRRWSLEDRGRSRNRSINPVWVIVNMRDSDGIYIVEFQRVHQK